MKRDLTLVLLLILSSCGRTAPTRSSGESLPVAVITPSSVDVVIGQQPVLNGLSSYDPLGEPLKFSWRLLSSPVQSTAALSQTSQPGTALSVDRVGTYVVELIVSADGRMSGPAVAVISAAAAPSDPVAVAGPDQTVRVGDTVTVNGSSSYDPLGSPLSFEWVITAQPPDSKASLSNPHSQLATLIPDREGFYAVSLTVSARGRSSSDALGINVTPLVNRPPIAEAGPNISAPEYSLVQLDGSASSDPDGDTLSFSWRTLSAPVSIGSVSLSSAYVSRPTFTPTATGIYTFELTVSDGKGHTAKDTTEVIVSPPGSNPAGEIFDPGEIYLAGTLSEGSCAMDAIAHWSTPNTASTGFDCSFNVDSAKIRPTDGRLLYSNSSEHLLREYHCDACIYSGTYPTQVLANDPTITVPCGSSPSNRLYNFLVGPDGTLLVACQLGASPQWETLSGAVVYDESAGTPMGLGAAGLLLTQSKIIDTRSDAATVITGLPARSWIATKWNAPDGWYVAISASSSLDPPELYRVSTSGSAILLGTYGALPTGTTTYSNPNSRIDKSGRLFSLGWDTTTTATHREIIIRRQVGQPSDVVYSEGTNPLVKINVSSLVSGP